MKTLLKSLAFLAVATLAGTALGYGIGDSFFYFNGTRYTGSNPYEESAGYADGAELGEITELTIGAELIVDGVLTNGMQSAWPKALSCTFTKRGGGELVLLKRNGWTGGTVFEEGTITVADPEALGISTLTIAGDVTINVPVGVTFVCPPLATDGTHTLAVTGGGVFTQPDSVPEGLTIADNTAGNASPLVGNTLHLAGGCQTVNVAADTIITSMVDDGSGAGKYTDIVKTGAGIEMVEGGARVHVTCRAGASAAAVDLSQINGVMSLLAGDDLGALAPKAASGITYSEGEATIFVPASAGRFVKAVIGQAAPEEE